MINEEKLIMIWQDFSNNVRLLLADEKHGNFNLNVNIHDGNIMKDYKIKFEENRKLK